MSGSNGNGSNGHSEKSWYMDQKKKHSGAPEPVAALYAKALFELAKENKVLDAVEKELNEVSAFLENHPEVLEAAEARSFSIESRLDFIKALTKKLELQPYVSKLVEILAARQRVSILPEIANAFLALQDLNSGIVRGSVTTVDALSDSEKEGLEKAFSKKLNKKVVLAQKIEKEILGGLIVQLQGQGLGLTFDGSLKTTLRGLRDSLERQSV
ncbi:MAG: ATP synthase F1 subunit delta [Bacteriovoracia bacterium]